MPRPNAIVDKVIGITPRIQAPAAEFLRAALEPVTVEFAGGQTATLDPADSRSGTYAEILDELRDMEAPAYIEVDPVTQAINRLLIPLTVRVAAIDALDSGALQVELEISHARHVLKPENPDFQELSQVLHDAKARQLSVTVTETDDHEIIDVRTAPNRFAASAPAAPLPEMELAREAVSPEQARRLFGLVNGKSCDPRTVPPPCIPFLYPDDGCWGRAHEMCRLMIADGAQPGKIWIYGNLRAKTRNNPACEVRWGWHVAPTLQVQVGSTKVLTVIDPSLFNEPAQAKTWKEVQGDPNAGLVETDATIFYRSSTGATETDSDYKKSDEVLRRYRLQLKNRSASAAGPPPYSHCG